MAFATAQDLFDYLQIESPTSGQTTRAELLVELAQAAIEEETQQRLSDGSASLEEQEDTVTLDGNGREQIRLPRWPVTAVASVTEDGDALDFDDDYRWSREGILYRVDDWWEDKPRIVTVTYTAGFSPVPTDLKRLCIQVSARAWGNPEATSSRSIERVGSSRWETRGLELSGDERRRARRWAA